MQLFPTQVLEILTFRQSTIGRGNYSIRFTSPRNRTQEADGSIPFISTKVFRGFRCTAA